MGKVEKKRAKLTARIAELKDELRMSLTKKTSSTKEVSLPEFYKKIGILENQLKEL